MSPEMVVLDGHPLNPGDLSWAPLEQLGKCTVYARTDRGELVARAREASILLTNKTVLDAECLAALPKLRYIGVLATGYNVVDINAAGARDITVTNVPGYGTRSVAQHTLALLLELTNHVGHHSIQTAQGGWTLANQWCYWARPLTELDGLTLGIIGFGAIGRCVAQMARAFGMRVLAAAHKPSPPEPGVSWVDREELLRSSDVVSLHCPLTNLTRSLINAKTLGLMKPSAFLINTARGPLIDEAALADSLRNGQIAGAALDVLSVEPPPRDHPLLCEPRCLITPHQAWATCAARSRLLGIAAENVRAFLAGRPVNVIGVVVAGFLWGVPLGLFAAISRAISRSFCA